MPKGQLTLFASPALSSRPFQRYSRKLDEVRICSRCGREIIMQRRTRTGVVSENLSDAGECRDCTSQAR
jgi:hypothetical protein